MLDINPELVREIIFKVREFQAKEDVVIPEDFDNEIYESDINQVLADHADDLTYQELLSAIDELEPDQQYELVALALLGRGEYTADEWELAIEEAQSIEQQNIPSFLLATPYMANFLKEGLVMLEVDDE